MNTKQSHSLMHLENNFFFKETILLLKHAGQNKKSLMSSRQTGYAFLLQYAMMWTALRIKSKNLQAFS